MRSTVEIAIIGGGVFGASAAAHLAKHGQRDVLLIEAHDIGSQTTAQAAGLVPLLRSNELLTEMARYSLECFETFRRDIGDDIQFHQVGSLKLALTAARAVELQQLVQIAQRLNVPMQLISVQEARQRMPVLDLEGTQAVTFAARDGYVGQPAAIARGYAAYASRAGVEVATKTQVIHLHVAGGRIQGLETTQGMVRVNRVILTAGAWTPGLAQLTGVTVPTVAVRHQLQVTGPLPGIQPDQPVVRIPDCSTYIRPEGQGLIVGAFEEYPRSYLPTEISTTFRVSDVEPNRDSLDRHTARITPYVPSLQGARIMRTQQGLPTFTPDGHPLLGEVPSIRGLYVACGCCATGISLSPAIGRLLAELLTGGEPFIDISLLTLNRFANFGQDSLQLRHACERVYANYYAQGKGKI
jgi:glycine/D-amino acid oxidase-like deaminating enzyme